MDWKIRNIRLQELREIYQEKLKNIAYRVYESHFQNGIVKQEELEGEIMSYYQHTQPSLQEFYSHYATQWEHFYEGHELTDSAFLRFLENSAYPLQMKYNRGDLNLQYYIDRFHTLKKRSKEWKHLRNLFFDKWYHLLANNEYNYQIERINNLCERFYRLQKNIADQLPQRGNARLMWLLRTHQELAKQLFHYDEIAKNHPAIRELTKILGKQHYGKEKKFRMVAGIHREQIITHATKSDITGVCEGNDLNSLLPIEYCYLSDPALQPLFFERFNKKKLQMMDYESKDQHRIKDIKIQGNEIVEEQSGPFIICVEYFRIHEWRKRRVREIGHSCHCRTYRTTRSKMLSYKFLQRHSLYRNRTSGTKYTGTGKLSLSKFSWGYRFNSRTSTRNIHSKNKVLSKCRFSNDVRF